MKLIIKTEHFYITEMLINTLSYTLCKQKAYVSKGCEFENDRLLYGFE